VLSNRTKYLLKLTRGWSSVEVSQYYNVSESSIAGHSFTGLTHVPPPVVKPLYSGEHYMNLCWFKLYLDEG